MINKIIEDLNKLESRYDTNLISNNMETILAYIIYLKYLCDNGTYSYDEVFDYDDLYPLTRDIGVLCNLFRKKNIFINPLVKKYRDFDIKDLVNEYLDYIEKGIEFHSKNDKVLYINYDRHIYNTYNRYGNATYCYKNRPLDYYGIFKAFDDILGISNKYIPVDKSIDVSSYDYVYIYDMTPSYKYKDYNIYDSIYSYIKKDKKVVLDTKYSIISNFKNGRLIARYMKTIVLNDDKAVMLFDGNNYNGEISIINYDKKVIKSIDDLYSVISNNRKRKDILVKTNYKELADNNLRIGFKLYQLEKENKIKDINKIVDENTKYLDMLNYINSNVEKEINKLLNR